MKSIFRFLCILGSIGCILAIMLGFLGRFHPALDTFSHFRLHLSIGLLGAFFVLMVLRIKIISVVVLLFSMLGIYSSASGTIVTKRQVSAIANLPTYKLFHFNLLWVNREKQAVIDEIRRLDPDIISLTEQSSKWRGLLAQLLDTWPYKYSCGQKGYIYGTGIFSKWPIIEGSEHCGEYGSLVRTDLMTPQGEMITFAAAHFRWPWPASGPKQMQSALPQIRSFGDNALVAGDFNAVTWSWAVEKFSLAGGLEIIPGIGSTWIADVPLVKNMYWAGLPIDNVLQKGKLRVLSAKTLGELGSDHLPVWVEFQVTK